MKKYILFIVSLLILSASLFCSCNSIDHPISGHTYCYDSRTAISQYGSTHMSSGIVEYLKFHSNGTMEIESKLYEEGASSPKTDITTNHLIYSVDGNTIIVSHDNSLYWKASYRGKELERYTYNSADNTIKASSGAIFKFLL